MNKKHYTYTIFGIILILFYIFYLIIEYKYKEYKINSHIEYINKLNNNIKKQIEIAQKIIEYKKSKAYKNKILKQDLGYKNKAEKVINLIPENKYNKFTKKTTFELINENTKKEKKENIIYGMTIYEKWIYFLFKKDIR